MLKAYPNPIIPTIANVTGLRPISFLRTTLESLCYQAGGIHSSQKLQAHCYPSSRVSLSLSLSSSLVRQCPFPSRDGNVAVPRTLGIGRSAVNSVSLSCVKSRRGSHQALSRRTFDNFGCQAETCLPQHCDPISQTSLSLT